MFECGLAAWAWHNAASPTTIRKREGRNCSGTNQQKRRKAPTERCRTTREPLSSSLTVSLQPDALLGRHVILQLC
jgi:hypothetical protein